MVEGPRRSMPRSTVARRSSRCSSDRGADVAFPALVRAARRAAGIDVADAQGGRAREGRHHAHAAAGARGRARCPPPDPTCSRGDGLVRGGASASPIPATSARSCAAPRRRARRQSCSVPDRSTPTIPRSFGRRPVRSSGSRWWTRIGRWSAVEALDALGELGRLGGAVAGTGASPHRRRLPRPDRGRPRERGPRDRRRGSTPASTATCTSRWRGPPSR